MLLFFRSEKRKLKTGSSPSEWDLYDSIHKVLRRSNVENCEELVEESYNATEGNLTVCFYKLKY